MGWGSSPLLGTHSGWGHWCWLQCLRMGLGLFLWSHRCRCTMWWSRRRRQPYLVNWIPVVRGRGSRLPRGWLGEAPTALPGASGTVSSGKPGGPIPPPSVPLLSLPPMSLRTPPLTSLSLNPRCTVCGDMAASLHRGPDLNTALAPQPQPGDPTRQASTP